ncbi:MAG: hypothetical protein COA99_02105 [Moraxellaceae bacterium]|nr:MAG: hypothetical protein COA99_02105 [Moraxellaceae bacterium]
MDEYAPQVIAQQESITVENNVFDLFWGACSKASKPNNALNKYLYTYPSCKARGSRYQ